METPPFCRQHGGKRGLGLHQPAGGYIVHGDKALSTRPEPGARLDAAGAKQPPLAPVRSGSWASRWAEGQTSVCGRGRHSPGRGGQIVTVSVPWWCPPLSPSLPGTLRTSSPLPAPLHLPLAFAVCTGQPAPPRPGRGMSVDSVLAGGPGNGRAAGTGGDRGQSRFSRGRLWRRPALSLTPAAAATSSLGPWPAPRAEARRHGRSSLASSCPRADSCRRKMLTSRSTWRRRPRRRRG